MTKLHLILDYLNSRPEASQREIANSTGISLGQTNAILKELSDNGLLKHEQVSKKKKRYLLTQRGVAEKALLSNERVLSIIKDYKNVKKSVTDLLHRLHKQGYKEFVLEGERGEIYEVIKDVYDEHFIDKATLIWGPSDEKEGQIILSLSRRFLKAENVVNVLQEISI